MADDERETEGTSRGTDWEVVTLTESTYLAAPSQKGEINQIIDQNSNKNKQGSSLFTSDQFLFPSDEHENLPVQTEFDQIEMKEKDLETIETLPIMKEEETLQERNPTIQDTMDSKEEGSDEKLGFDAKEESRREKAGKFSEWVKQVKWICNQAKEANVFWSVVVAAAFVGIAILGHRWHHEKSRSGNTAVRR